MRVPVPSARPLLVLGASACAIALLGSGIALADSRLNPVRSDGSISACLDNKTYVVRAMPAGHGCRASETPFSINASRSQVKGGADGQAGTKGDTGPQGPAGKDGAAGSQGAKGDAGPAGTQGPAGRDGATGPQGPAGKDGANGKDAAYVGEHWGVIDRNVIGDGDSSLRSGPFTGTQAPPLGQGSLAVRTGSGSSAMAFGNEVDFRGQLVKDLSAVGFSVYRTAEDASINANNMPDLAIEVDPMNVDTSAPHYTTLKFLPNGTTANTWASIDAMQSTAGGWALTGSYFENPGRCGINTQQRCTLEQAKLALGLNAKILTVAVAKGRDYAFSGAVDALKINTQMFDFEPFGVYTKNAG